MVGEIPPHDLAGRDLEKLIGEITAAEGIDRADVAVISDEGMAETPGIRLELNLGQILDYYNKKIISRDALLGLMGSFGIPHAVAVDVRAPADRDEQERTLEIRH